MNPELIEQKKHVIDIIYYLLSGPDGADWQFNGGFPTRKMMVEIPEGFAYLALYLEKLGQNPGHPVKNWEALEKSFFNANHKDALYRTIKIYIRSHLNTVLWSEGHDALHYFFHGYNWRLYTKEQLQKMEKEEEERQRSKSDDSPDDETQFGKWDYDDDLPF